MKAVSETNASVDGEEYYEDDISKWRALRQLSCGFYYRWAWEQVGGRDEEWLEKRKEWHRFLRDELGKNAEVGYDSPALIARNSHLTSRTIRRFSGTPDLHYVYNEWCGVKDRPKPPTVPVWVSSYFIDDCVARLTRAKSHTILWYESEAVAIAPAERGVRVCTVGYRNAGQVGVVRSVDSRTRHREELAGMEPQPSSRRCRARVRLRAASWSHAQAGPGRG